MILKIISLLVNKKHRINFDVFSKHQESSWWLLKFEFSKLNISFEIIDLKRFLFHTTKGSEFIDNKLFKNNNDSLKVFSVLILSDKTTSIMYSK